jgi:hypothetical protein
MKLYTEEQVRMAMHLTTLTKETYNEVLKQLTPIDLPSDEEIEESETDSPYDRIDEYNYGFIDGANWVKDFIINQTNETISKSKF